MDVIETRDLGRIFGESPAVEGLTLNIGRGEIFGLVGPDGAGKTTTMRMLTAILTPTSGEARVLGLDVRTEGEAIKDRIGYMSQRFGLYPDLTVEENIVFYADLYGVPRKERPARMTELLGFSNLTPFRRRAAANLSGGMKQKLGLACALIHTPEVLFLDEPTNGVDPVSRRDFWRILYRLLRDGVTIFVSTAYLDEAERCGRVALMDKGRVLACDTPQGVKGLLEGTMVEIPCGDSRRAAARLREAGLAHVAAFGDRVHAALPGGGATPSSLAALLRDAGLSPGEARVVEPSLEDVFMAAVGGEEAP